MGIVWGVAASDPLVIILFLLPAAIYEVYRTEGVSTKWASIAMLLVLIAEIGLILFNVNFNLAEFLGQGEELVGGYWVPLGNIKVLGPTLLAVLSAVLVARTRGRYTIWLAVIILVTSFALVYTLDPTIFKELLRLGVKEGVRELRY